MNLPGGLPLAFVDSPTSVVTPAGSNQTLLNSAQTASSLRLTLALLPLARNWTLGWTWRVQDEIRPAQTIAPPTPTLYFDTVSGAIAQAFSLTPTVVGTYSGKGTLSTMSISITDPVPTPSDSTAFELNIGMSTTLAVRIFPIDGTSAVNVTVKHVLDASTACSIPFLP